MKIRSFARSLVLFALVCGLGASALADTIRMKDGQVIRGQIVGFRDQQFTVLIGSGAGARRSRITLYMEDVESIEFEGAANAGGGDAVGPAASARNDTIDTDNGRTQQTPVQQSSTQRQQTETARPTLGTNNGGNSTSNAPSSTARNNTPATGGDSQYFPIRIRVRADSTANGWTDSGLMVRRGQRLRISASGRVSLGQGRFSTPTGLPRVMDTEKLMGSEPTGALIAVIGDDNNDFIFVGANREIIAPRDGRLFLGVNEGRLDDNTGTYDALVEAEPISGGGR